MAAMFFADNIAISEVMTDIEKGSHGIVTLANASEGHLMLDEERKELLSFVVKKVNGRVPVVATVNHPSSYCAIQMARYAEATGADAVMCNSV